MQSRGSSIFLAILLLSFLDATRYALGQQFYSLSLESSSRCLVIPEEKIWPFSATDDPIQTKYLGTPDNARRYCNQMGMQLAKITTNDESWEIQRWRGIAC